MISESTENTEVCYCFVVCFISKCSSPVVESSHYLRKYGKLMLGKKAANA